MSGLQLVQTLNSTPFVLLWLFHCGSWDISFLRKGLGVIKAVGVRTGRSPPMPPQCWRDRTGELQPASAWWEGGNKEEERVCGNKTPQCCCGRAASPASRYAGGKGQLCGTCAVCGDEAGTGEAKLCARCTAQGDARRVRAVGGPSPISQHKPSEGACRPSLGCAEKDVADRGAHHIRQEQKCPWRCACQRQPLILGWHGRWGSSSAWPQIHSGSLEEIRGRSKITRGAFALWGARSCVMLCVCERRKMARASAAISAGLRDLPLCGTACVRKTDVHKSH